MKAKRRFSFLSLLTSWVFLSIPFFLILTDWSTSRQREFTRQRDTFVQRAQDQLEKMQVSCSWEFQVLQQLNGFQRLLRQQLTFSNKSQLKKSVKNLFTSNLSANLPANHLMIAVKEADEDLLKPVLFNSTLDGKNLLESFAPLMDRQPCSKKQFERAGNDLRVMTGFPVNVHSIASRQNHIRGKDEGIIMPFNSKEGVSWLYWFYYRGSGQESEPRVLLTAIFKANRIEKNYSYLTLTQDLPHNQAGIAVFPLFKRDTEFYSPLINSNPGLKKFLRRLAPDLPLRQSQHKYADYTVFAAPVLVGKSAMMVLVKLNPVAIPLSGLETAFVTLILLLFAGLSLLLVQRQVFRRGWRISIGLVLLTAIVSIFYLPAGIGRMIVKYSIDSSLSSMKKEAEDQLELNLQRLEDRYNLTLADYYYRLQHLEDYPEIMQLISARKPEKALSAIKKKVQSQYPCKKIDNSLIFLSLQGEDGQNTLWLTTTDKTQGLADMFAPLLRGALHKFRPDLIRSSLMATVNMSLKDVKDELVTDFLVQFFQGILGQEMFHRLMADPRSLVEVNSTFMIISATGVPVKINGMIRALLLAIWSQFNECEDYLDYLIETPGQLSANFDFVALRKGSFQRYYKTTTPVTPEIWDLLERTRRVGIQQTSREQLQSEDRLLMKSKPGKALGLYVLVGVTSLKDVFARQLELEKVFNRLMTLGFVLLSLLVAVLYRYFIGPLQQLQVGLDQVARGDFQTRISRADHDDEFGRIARSFNAMAKGLQEGSLLGRFVSSAVMNVIKDKSAFKRAMAGERRQMTILFASYKISETDEAESLLNQFAFHLQVCQDSLQNTAGVIDKVMESKILVFFDHIACSGADKAVRQCFSAVHSLKQGLAKKNIVGYYGIATGSVVAGILGARDIRLDYTVIGDAVNLSARLNAVAAKDDGSKVIFDQETRRYLNSDASGTDLGEINIKGKNKPQPIYRL